MVLSIDPAGDLGATRTSHLKPFFFLSSLQVVSIAQYLSEGELEPVALLLLDPCLG